MPEPLSLDGAEIGKPCARCNTINAILVVRGESLCKDCFMKYVGSKLIKRLEMNKTRGGFHEAQKNLLVPVNYDLSSICLLHVLDQQLHKRVESGRHASYTLHVFCIDESSIREDLGIQNLLPLLKQRFPNYICSVIPLEDCYTYGIDLDHLVPKPDGVAVGEDTKKAIRLQNLLSILPSATSKADVIEILRRRLTAAFAKQNGCDSILYGDSTTKLAERILSETAKGRGGALPWLTSDNAIMDGVSSSYPLRDLLQKELALYADITFPSLMPLILPSDSKAGAISSKDMTIDGLMSQYFESVEENFPSIVANVVRTSSKLAPRSEFRLGEACDLCRLPVNDVEWGGEQGSPAPINQVEDVETRSDQRLCAGCARTLQMP